MKIKNLLKNFFYKYFKKDSHYYSDNNEEHVLSEDNFKRKD